MILFTPEELAELAAYDARVEAEPLTNEEIAESRERDRMAIDAERDVKGRKVAEQQRAYYQANREKLAEQKRAYYQANREKVAEYMRAYYQANREKVAEQKRAYYQANREKVAEQQRAYRARKKQERMQRGEDGP